ncbi:hypothetical protein Tco_1212391 [Tanacetum coccineum]
MRNRECSGIKWELTRIPCKHVVAPIWNMANNGEETGIPESYCHQVYCLSTWKEMYRKCPNEPSASHAQDPNAQATQTQQSSQALPATQPSKTAPTTQSLQTAPTTQASQNAQTAPSTSMNRPFHHSQLHASPTKMTKETSTRRMSTG